jgi:hypothetical protein
LDLLEELGEPWGKRGDSGGESVRLLRPSNLLGRAFGFLGRVVLKIGVTRRLVLAVAGIAAIVILVFVILTLVSLGR